VQQLQAELAQLAGAQALVLGGRSARLLAETGMLAGGERLPASVLRFLDQRAHHVRLAPGAQLLADPLVCARALRGARRHVRGDRPSALRQLAQACHVEVAVLGQCQRARDRRCRHMQHVGRQVFGALAIQRRALAYAEAVLLVHDRHREAVENNVVLDQSMRADHQLQLTGGQLAQ
jgi:hypothetical protein